MFVHSGAGSSEGKKRGASVLCFCGRAPKGRKMNTHRSGWERLQGTLAIQMEMELPLPTVPEATYTAEDRQSCGYGRSLTRHCSSFCKEPQDS